MTDKYAPIEAMIDELQRMADGMLEAVDCNYCDQELADTMRQMLEVVRAAEEAQAYVRGTNYYDSLVKLREALSQLTTEGE